MSFEDKLKQEMNDYCRFKCPVKGVSVAKVVDEDSYCSNCDNYSTVDYEVEISACDTCQVGEFIRHIRDMEVD